MSAKIFPDIPFPQWTQLWVKCYSSQYGEADDRAYLDRMIAVQAATDDSSLSSSLTALFTWKERLQNRWARGLASITLEVWNELKSSTEVPSVWKNGIVYNVFLLHAVSNGARPIIDQHAWRGYCYLTGRPQRPEFPASRAKGLKLYGEYEDWFRNQVLSGIRPRDLDKALMAFGQFCASQFKPIIEFQLTEN